jgi:hypothetical protein
LEGTILRPPALTRLLKAAVHDRHDLRLENFSPAQIRWAVEAGLGPWLLRCTRRDAGARTSPLWPLVHGADLTARVIVGGQMDALEEILQACEDHAPPLTLLKGIALCDQYYPEPHLRLMGDLDLLTDQASVPAIESRLLRLGYVHRSETPPDFYRTHHHITPLFHPGRRVWVEVHRGLVPSSSLVGRDSVFSLENVHTELRPSSFRGRRVNRLSDDLQAVHLASHWALGFGRVRGMVGMIDLSRLLANAPALRWDRILAWLDGSPGAATCLHLLLSYLRRRRLADVAPRILRVLASRQQSLSAVNLAILHAVIDRYVVAGGRFGFLMSDRNFDIIRAALLSPGRPSQNLGQAVWKLLPSWVWFTQTVMRRSPR